MKNSAFNSLVCLILVSLSSPTLFARSCDGLPRWLNLREVRFQVVEPTEVYHVKIQFPVLSGINREESHFEYGTDYYFKLKSSQRPKLEYFKSGANQPSRTTEDSSGYLTAHSVMLAAERALTPHYLEVTDEDLLVNYEVYLSKNRGPSYVKRKGSNQRLKVVGYR